MVALEPISVLLLLLAAVGIWITLRLVFGIPGFQSALAVTALGAVLLPFVYDAGFFIFAALAGIGAAVATAIYGANYKEVAVLYAVLLFVRAIIPA